MERKESKSMHRTMRALHRDAGFLVIGFVIIYALSGIILIYRDTNFMKKEVVMERKLPPNLPDEQLGMQVRMPGFKVEKTAGEWVYFSGGSYNRSTGMATMTMKQVRFPFNKLIELHKIMSSKGIHWFTVVFGTVLIFMAISSLWMFKPGTKLFGRGLLLAGIGIIITIILLLFT
jgi:hypothetical protein